MIILKAMLIWGREVRNIYEKRSQNNQISLIA